MVVRNEANSNSAPDLVRASLSLDARVQNGLAETGRRTSPDH